MPINENNLNPLDGLNDFDNITPSENFVKMGREANRKKEIENLRQFENIQHNLNYTNIEAFEDAKSLNRISYAMEQYRREKSFDRKDGFFVNNEMLKENNVPIQYWNEFNGANSPEQFSEILSNLNTEIETRDRLSKNGSISSFGWEAAASITDPVQLAIGVATGGIGAVGKGGTLAKLGTSYAIGAAEGAVVGSLINQGLHTYTVQDIFVESALSGLFSAGMTGIGLGANKFARRGDKNFADWQEMQAVKEAKRKQDVLDGDDIDYNKEVNIEVESTKFKEKMVAYTYRQAIEDEYFNTDAMTEIVDTWQGQVFKMAQDVEVKGAEIDKIIALKNKEGVSEVQLMELNNLESTLKAEFDELSVAANKAQDEFEGYQTLSPVEQIGFVGKKKNELLGEVDPDVNMRSVIAGLFDSAIESDKKLLKELDDKIESLDPDSDELLELTRQRDEILDDFEDIEDSGIDNVRNAIINNEADLPQSDYVEGSVGAAKTRDVGTNFDTFSDTYDVYDAPATAKQEQEAFDDVGENVNNSYPTWMINLMTNQEKLNVLGGSARKFGTLIYGRIAQKQNNVALQKANYSDLFLSPKMSKAVDQFTRELSEVSGEKISTKQAEIIGKKVINGVNEGVSEAQAKIANKFNDNTVYWFQKYNNIKQIPVEIEKQFIQREYGTRFQNILEKSIDGDSIPLAMAYQNQFGARATRNAGLRTARHKMNEMLSVYHLDEAKFNEKYPNMSDEFKKSISLASDELDVIYKDMAQKAIDVGLDDEGILQEALAKGGKYMPRAWDSARFNQADQVYGTEQIYDLFQEAIEAANDTSRFSRKTQKKILSGKIDEVEAEKAGTGKPISRIISEAIVNHTIQRNRTNVAVNPNEMRVAFEKALTDINKFINDHYETLKGNLDESDLTLLREFAEQEADSFKTKQGLEKHKQSRIEIDVFHEKQLERVDGEMQPVSISMFMDLNSERVMQGYLNTFSSHVSFAKAGIKSLDDLNSMINELEQHNNAVKDRANSVEATKEEIRQGKLALTDDYLNFFKDNSMQLWHGTSSIDYNNKLNRYLQYLGNYNFMRMMGKMGISQTSEISEVAHQGGLTTMLKSMPAFKTFRTTLRNANKEELETLSESLEMFGMTGDNHSASFFNDVGDDMSMISVDEYDNPFNVRVDRNESKIAAAEDVFHKGTRYAGLVGSKMDKYTRTWAVQGAYSELDRLSRFFTNSEGDVVWNKKQKENFTKRGINKDTLIEYGITLDELPMIKEAFDKYATFTTSTKSGNRIIKNVDFKQMIADNNPAFEKLRTFAIQAQNEVVAPSTIGNSYKSLVDNQIMKTLFQFRTYPLQSLDHKLRNKLRVNNNVSAYLLLGAMTGFVSYSLNVLANAAKYENSEDYLKEQFSTSKLIAGSYSRSVYAYFFQAILGSLEETFIGSNVFDNSTRTSGLSQSLLGNPTFDLIDNVSNLGKNTASYVSGQDPEGMTKGFRNLINLLPFAAAPIIGEGLKVGAQSGKTYEK